MNTTKGLPSEEEMTNGSKPQPTANADLPKADTGRIVLVDDEPELLSLLKSMLIRSGYEVSAHSTPDAARQFVQNNAGWPDIILTDLNMPQEDGLSLLEGLLKDDDTLVGMILTGYGSTQNAVQAMRIGVFDFVMKPVNSAAIVSAVQRALRHRRVLLENRNYQRHMEELVQERSAALENALQQLEKAYQFTLQSLVSMLEAREKSTGEHTKRVTAMSLVLARTLGVNDTELETIKQGAFLHDIGKVAIPDSILLKPGPLDPDEWAIMKTHAAIGYSILRRNPDIQNVAQVVYSHHEHFDGSGYPRGLKGDDICLGARIFAVVDAYDAIRSRRPYSEPRSAEDTFREIDRCRTTQFDPVIVDALKSCQDDIEKAWIDHTMAGAIQATMPSPVEKISSPDPTAP